MNFMENTWYFSRFLEATNTILIQILYCQQSLVLVVILNSELYNIWKFNYKPSLLRHLVWISLEFFLWKILFTSLRIINKMNKYLPDTCFLLYWEYLWNSTTTTTLKNINCGTVKPHRSLLLYIDEEFRDYFKIKDCIALVGLIEVSVWFISIDIASLASQTWL